MELEHFLLNAILWMTTPKDINVDDDIYYERLKLLRYLENLERDMNLNHPYPENWRYVE